MNSIKKKLYQLIIFFWSYRASEDFYKTIKKIINKKIDLTPRRNYAWINYLCTSVRKAGGASHEVCKKKKWRLTSSRNLVTISPFLPMMLPTSCKQKNKIK